MRETSWDGFSFVNEMPRIILKGNNKAKVKEKLDKHTLTGYCSDLIDRKAKVKNIIEGVINNMTDDEDGGDGLCF
ncbi:uncharacterized protein A4U43_C04F27350 [Asparagus officinalis]|uniref:Uncharacterized protein n=1 Tax=Asparagus officinalis TaxID=4686 RepID=A0A5P1F8M8_ASPOF|nr:uncharacterized protein A4U43_C04F27350 [Asparagus officinalis]